VKKKGDYSPWGTIQSVKTIFDGCQFVSTAGHGGYYLTPELNQKVPKYLKNVSWGQQATKGWYEEDCDAIFVVLSFPTNFSQNSYDIAKKMLKSYKPNVYELIFEEKNNGPR